MLTRRRRFFTVPPLNRLNQSYRMHRAQRQSKSKTLLLTLKIRPCITLTKTLINLLSRGLKKNPSMRRLQNCKILLNIKVPKSTFLK